MSLQRLKTLLIILLGFLVGALGALWLFAHNRQAIVQTNQDKVSTTVVAGKASIGGAFSLVDQNGKSVRDTDFDGRFRMIYFGYTYCPDVCPTELQKMTRVLKALGPKAALIQPILITVDPQRDTVKQLKSYMPNFFPGFVGLTGSSEKIKNVMKLYRVYAKPVKDESSSADYLMDHSSYIYFMNKDGTFVDLFGFDKTEEQILTKIKPFLQ